MRLSLSTYEMELVRKQIGREPLESEWKVIDALWSEHCSYKSSKIFLRTFPTGGENVIMGIEDWQDAGAVDLGDGLALVLKVESHNHPSAIDPFNGAATGVGGIIRDIVSKGAKPIALLDMIRVGDLGSERNRWLLKGIISGIGFYGNSIGVPVVGGELSFDESYNDNPLVDVACAGIVKKDKIIPSVVKKSGLKLVLVGLTGIDGLGGASFASRKLSGEDEIGAVQIADPFAGKIIIDATLEVSDKVEAIKDLGGGGLAVAVTEMANGLGANIKLENVPLRVKEMTPEDIIVSETQERMLFAVEEGNVQSVCKSFEYYEYPCAVIGEITEDKIIRFTFEGKEIVSLPSELLLSPPLYMWGTSTERRGMKPRIAVEIGQAIRKVLTHPDMVSKEWAYSQFDYEVGISTVIKPGEADASLVKLPNGKFLALKGDANPELCLYNSYECGKAIFAEVYRNLATVGSIGVAAVDHLQFGDPRRPEVYQDFVNSVRGISEASKVLNVPIVGGKVSFYNENLRGEAIKPTPLIVMAGISEKFFRPKIDEDQYIVLLGITKDQLAGSLYHKLFGGEEETPNEILYEDLITSKFVTQLIREGKVEFVKDISKGGIIGSLWPIIVKGYSVSLNIDSIIGASRVESKLFSENGGRFILLTQNLEEIISRSRDNGIFSSQIGKVKGREKIGLSLNDKFLDLTEEVDKYYSFLEGMQ
ncbi:phosphoribosylformylglycinamidine synthase subunit PurL [Acidianus sp. RZ1]|uniref:phosphoribosylformylglycinamidine synthase subunit PurL n=1 Tax=Acidianus sp. RZ1 TaxID=1540082 RepID=UPI001492EDB6|nr:phosphoribosylformylglycinamidine synthase subunit PurL [Acidianus sp. RZ1]NON62803.1 phosphoribosylformylglycinamidine synthase subunit PurL [Acidianus sp. RZ1]